MGLSHDSPLQLFTVVHHYYSPFFTVVRHYSSFSRHGSPMFTQYYWFTTCCWLIIKTGWWFGTFFSHILGCCHHPNWRTPSFFRGVALAHQPDHHPIIKIISRGETVSFRLRSKEIKCDLKWFLGRNRRLEIQMGWCDPAIRSASRNFYGQKNECQLSRLKKIGIYMININNINWSVFFGIARKALFVGTKSHFRSPRQGLIECVRIMLCSYFPQENKGLFQKILYPEIIRDPWIFPTEPFFSWSHTAV